MSMLEQMKDKREKPTLKHTIEENLRKVYQDLLQEDVPDRFKLLLEELRQKQAAPEAAANPMPTPHRRTGNDGDQHAGNADGPARGTRPPPARHARLCHQPDPECRRCDDLVQDAIVKAWSSFDKFEPGTNMRAWLFTILRNTFYSGVRKRRRDVADPEGVHTATLFEKPAHDGKLALNDFMVAFNQLSPVHREVLILVGASGFSYEEAAEMTGHGKKAAPAVRGSGLPNSSGLRKAKNSWVRMPRPWR